MCPFGLLDTITMRFFDLIVVCVTNVELNVGELLWENTYFFDLAITIPNVVAVLLHKSGCTATVAEMYCTVVFVPQVRKPLAEKVV